jgi:glycerol uptake facilitator-like aquaporin
MFGRKGATQPVAEFLGTYALVSAVLAMASLTDSPFFPAVAAGLTLGVMVLVIGPLSGAHINPAVSFGLWTLRKVPASTALVFVAAQMLAGFTALKMNEYLLDESVPALTSSGWDWRIVLAEGIGALIFTFGIATAILGNYEDGKLAAAIGGSLFIGVLAAALGSTGALNPAVALGINSWSISYVIGPLVGAAAGMNLAAFLFASGSSEE